MPPRPMRWPCSAACGEPVNLSLRRLLGIQTAFAGHRSWACLFFISCFISTAWAGSLEIYLNALKNDQVSPILGLQLRYFDLNTRDEKGTPPLVIAIANDSLNVAEYLIQQRGLDLDATNANGENALMMAALKGQLSTAQALLKRGAQVNKPGWTPLHYAASSPAPESEKMARLLLDNYAYIDAASPNQTTPLMMAARYGSGTVVELLLKEGADPALKNDKGMSAVDFARSVGRDNVIALITAHLVQTHSQASTSPQQANGPQPPLANGAEAAVDPAGSTESLPIAVPAVQAFSLDGAVLPSPVDGQLAAPEVEAPLVGPLPAVESQPPEQTPAVPEKAVPDEMPEPADPVPEPVLPLATDSW